MGVGGVQPDFHPSVGSVCIGGLRGQSVIKHQGKYRTSNLGSFFLFLLFLFSLNPISPSTASGFDTPNTKISVSNWRYLYLRE